MKRGFSRSDQWETGKGAKISVKEGEGSKEKEESDAKTLGQNSLLLSQTGLKRSILLTSQVRSYMYIPLIPTQ